jgi:hypothetical protein
MIKMFRQRCHEPTLYVLVLCMHVFILAREFVMLICFTDYCLQNFRPNERGGLHEIAA